MNDSSINQLVYKPYLNDGNNLVKNNFFRQQLFIDLKCEGFSSKDVEYINYDKKDLERLFLTYNECVRSDYIIYESKQKQDLFNLTFKPGLSLSHLTVNTNDNSRCIDLGNDLNFRFGAEAEFILPYNKNKWALLFVPAFQYFTSEKTDDVSYISGGILVSKVNYHSIELPIGVRHYFFINENLKFFVNLSYIFDLSNNSTIELTRSDGSIYSSFKVKSGENLSFSVGNKYKDKYSIEMRYQTNRDLLGDYLMWNSDYRTFSIICGYSLF
jgi:hypothetical protein